MENLSKIPGWIWIVTLGCLLFIPFLGSFWLVDGFETYIAEISREMIVSGNFTTVRLKFEPIWEDPPLYFWLQSLSYHIFGINEFGARFPSALIGIISLIIVYNIGRKLYSKKFGVMWSLFLAASFLPHVYFKFGFDEALFNLFIFLSTYFASILSFESEFTDYKSLKRIRFFSVSASALFAGLAVLCNGPIAIVVILLTSSIFYFMNRARPSFRFSEMILWLIILISISFSWYGWVMYENGIVTLNKWIDYHKQLFAPGEDIFGPIYLQLLIFYVGCFPAIIFIFDGIRKKGKDIQDQLYFKNLMYSLLASSIIILLITKTEKADYSSIGFYSVAFLAANYFDKLFRGDYGWKWYHTAQYIVLSLGWITILLVFEFDLIKDLGASSEIVNIFLISVFVALSIMNGVFIFKKKWQYTFIGLIFSGIFLSQFAWIQLISETIEHKQASKIEFIESKKDEDCYFATDIDKSYIHLYYGKMDSIGASKSFDELVLGKIDKKVYVITSIENKDFQTGSQYLDTLNLLDQTSVLRFYERKDQAGSR